MSDLISREEAIKIVKHYGACNKCDSRNGDMCGACRVGEEITAIQNAPTIEIDLQELEDRFGKYVRFVVEDMMSGEGKRWKNE